MITEKEDVVVEETTTVKTEEKTKGRKFKKKNKEDYNSRLSTAIGDLIDLKSLKLS